MCIRDRIYYAYTLDGLVVPAQIQLNPGNVDPGGDLSLEVGLGVFEAVVFDAQNPGEDPETLGLVAET